MILSPDKWIDTPFPVAKVAPSSRPGEGVNVNADPGFHPAGVS